MIILGIDPGSRFLGYGVISVESSRLKPIDYGVLKFNAELPLSERLHEIGLGVQQLFKTFKPSHLSLEKIFLGKNADSAFKMGHARGVIIYESLIAGCEVHEYATRVVKKGITGNGGAEKEHVRTVVCNLLQIPMLKSLDASDALAMACFHSSQLKVLEIKSRLKKQQKRPLEKSVG
ncbi:MAG: crossover junction endodeoxyribonuclease RuvC [Bdellovibrionales bacterium RIFCSPHIGHO2_01_FULL_40_29]|nr:MAG: crossover junction endodeoxyribonuclease RuvC [Bdellovibrionales bacterium RIFCSPHIGHO2_01_FULL_40_29]OFZ32696.1 MAG: crossover junction endodeoxyribonuclease RuvC [Bdellovibrionales bacterium RIFCSPHIGHO2_02_FULL_40_15]